VSVLWSKEPNGHNYIYSPPPTVGLLTLLTKLRLLQVSYWILYIDGTYSALSHTLLIFCNIICSGSLGIMQYLYYNLQHCPTRWYLYSLDSAISVLQYVMQHNPTRWFLYSLDSAISVYTTQHSPTQWYLYFLYFAISKLLYTLKHCPTCCYHYCLDSVMYYVYIVLHTLQRCPAQVLYSLDSDIFILFSAIGTILQYTVVPVPLLSGPCYSNITISSIVLFTK
jgi:hypothetical protein